MKIALDLDAQLNQEGFAVGPRLIGQILSDYGISKKTPEQEVKERQNQRSKERYHEDQKGRNGP